MEEQIKPKPIIGAEDSGNAKNMPEDQQISLKEAIQSEYLKCAADPIYFMKMYVYIQTSKGRQLFSLYKFQEKTLFLINKYDRNIILKSRQLGITTLCAGYILWMMIFKKDQSIVAIAPTQDKAINLVNKVRFAYEELPSWLKVESLEANKTSITLKNGSKIKAASGASDSARGLTGNVLVIDEAAFIANSEELWGSAQQILATGGKAIVLSTPNGIGNWFHKMWTEAEMNENNFIPIRLKWDIHPERDQKWRDEQDKELGIKMAKQECFDGDTRIYTDLGFEKIKNIKVGDKVLTHTGNFKKVTKVMSHTSEDLYRINSSMNKTKRYVTQNHPFWKDGEWLEIKKINDGEMLPSFIKFNNDDYIKSIEVFDCVKPIFFKLIKEEDNVYINDRKHKSRFPSKIDLDYDFGYILGLFLAEGYRTDNRITYCFNYKTEINDWPVDIANIFRDKYKIDKYQIRCSKYDNGGQISFCSQIMSLLLKKFYEGEYSYDKKLSKYAYSNMNTHLAKGIIDGVFKGDGCLLSKYRKSHSTVSEDLHYDILYLFKYLNIDGISSTSIVKNTSIFKEKEYNSKKAYIIYVNNSIKIEADNRNLSNVIEKRQESSRKNCEFKKDDILYSKLNKKDCEEIKTVYNIEVEDDHTYVTEHFIVHNCDADFLQSGDGYFEIEDLDYYRARLVDPIDMLWENKDYWIFEHPLPSKNYMVIVDTSRGDGKDYSTIQVLDVFSGNQVAEYRGNMDTKMLSKRSIEVSLHYNNALLIIENTGIGHSTISDVVEIGYNNIFYSPKGDTTDVAQYTQRYYQNDLSRMTAGFTTSTKTRPLILHTMRQYIKDHLIQIRSRRTFSEMTTFIWSNNKPQAQNGYNDDLVMMYAIGLYLRDSAIEFSSQGLEMQKTLLSNFKRNTDFQKVMTSTTNKQDPFKMNIGGKMEDITWLIR